MRQKMMEILKRVHEEDLEDDILEEDCDEKDSPLDSDDEQEVNKIDILMNHTILCTKIAHLSLVVFYSFQI